MELIKQALTYKNCTVWHVFPTYGEAKDVVWRSQMLFDIIPKEVISRVNETELVVYFKNGSVYQLKGSEDADAFRGANPFGVVFDEFDTQKVDGWPIIEPILRANGGFAWFIGTPRGKKKLYEFYHRGQGQSEEWQSWLLKASTSGIIPLDQLAESRLSMPQTLYNQEWECDFLEGEGSVFRNVRLAMGSTPQPPIGNRLYVMGVDLAKVQDWTVISVFDRETNAQVYQDRFQTIEWPFQKKKIQIIAQHYHNALVMLDATGIGDPIADDLLRAGVAVEPIKFTEQSKKDLVEKLSLSIEQRAIKLLPIEDSMLEYDNFSYELGPTGKIRYGARQGFHDDIVLSHALAVWSLQPLYNAITEAEPTKIAQEYSKRLKEFNSDNEDEHAWNEWLNDE